MESITELGKMNRQQLATELVGIVATLASRIRELGALQSDINHVWYPAYAQEPATSVAAKERAAEYASIHLLEDKSSLLADIDALTVTRDLIVTLLRYAGN
jgi:hypothetical protein